MNDCRAGCPPKYSSWLVFLGMLLLGGVLGHPFAGSWNDGSRLASIESVAERETFILDGSMFVFPHGPKLGLPNPYDPQSEILAKRGTLDLMQIEGHFYSDKSPLPTVVLAGIWKIFRLLGAPEPAVDPVLFCRTMNFLAGALPLALGAAALWILSWRLSGQPKQAIWLFIAGVFSGLPVAYSRFANNHIVVWAAVAWLFLFLDGLSRGDRKPFWKIVLAGICLGVAYATDSGIGPGLFVATLVWTGLNPKELVYRWAGLSLGAIPFVFSHHSLGYLIAGTWGPMNANPAFFQWLGCPFPPESLTGGFKHPNFGKFCLYTGDMLFGKKGFVFHTGVGLVGLLMLFRLLGAKSASLPKGMVLMAGIAFLVGVLVYALGSNNQSGLCRSVRWFVPLGIPLWYVSSPLIRESGWKNRVFVLSTSVGLWVAACGAWFGPWNGNVLPGYWVIVVVLVSLGGFSLCQTQKEWRTKPLDSEPKSS
ncbi:MAG: hypothetical protein NT142_04935 [Planctomycetota bacterium]|nr:hypothetical protein [Planctomycetota bacterium]